MQKTIDTYTKYKLKHTWEQLKGFINRNDVRSILKFDANYESNNKPKGEFKQSNTFRIFSCFTKFKNEI